MALVETQMVSTQDVFLPYAVMQDGRTLAERVRGARNFSSVAGLENLPTGSHLKIVRSAGGERDDMEA